MNKKIMQIITIISILVVYIVNMIFFNQLPDKIGLQVNTGGELRNYIPKNLFVILSPLLISVVYLFSLYNKKEDYLKTLIIYAVLIVANILMIIMNI